jgi:hypothetical protein
VFVFKSTITGAIAAVSLGAALQAGDDLRIVNPLAANPEPTPASGVQENAIASNFSLRRIAQGSDPLENPSSVIKWFGLLDDTDARQLRQNLGRRLSPTRTRTPATCGDARQRRPSGELFLPPPSAPLDVRRDAEY